MITGQLKLKTTYLQNIFKKLGINKWGGGHGLPFTYYAPINQARGPYEEIFVLTFDAYGLNAMSSMSIGLECQNKYF